MKSKFSTAWTASKQPRKQRKYLYNAPLHLKHKFLSAPLSKELRKKYDKRNIAIKKGDEVLVMRGSFKKKKAKVSSVDIKKSRVTLEGINRAKKDGTKFNVYFHPSKLILQTLNLDDKKRIKRMTNKSENKEKENVSDKS
ncbi:50S ribosomal protein L24 [Candidatus Pacearchaeota archaeon CG1_02_32_132]|nr:MAG: 50S ribosomal protein L24 [Candidatus Pacearchaeota archaeon CG1_02_32_132]